MFDLILTLPKGAPRPSCFHVAVAELERPDEVVYAVLPLAPVVFAVAAAAFVWRAVRERRGVRIARDGWGVSR